MNTKILILASNPEGTKPLKLQKEINVLKEKLKTSPNRDIFTIETNYCLHPENLQKILFDEKPNILHFCGHGEGEKGLVIENNLGQRHLIKKEAIAKAISHCEELECVLLNACDTDVQAEEIAKYVNYAIGMRQPILDPNAIAFSRGFYEALAYDKTISEAYELGCNQINIESDEVSDLSSSRNATRKKVNREDVKIPQYSIPQLFMKKNSTNNDGNSSLEEKPEFQKLRACLHEGKWRQADSITRILILRLTDSDSLETAIETIECRDLSQIDKLWLKYSNNRFGFSVQNLIYASLGNDDIKWSKKVGWRHCDRLEIIRNIFQRSLLGWLTYDELQFNLNAPEGHLPALGRHGYGKYGTLPLLKQLNLKLSKCSIC